MHLQQFNQNHAVMRHSSFFDKNYHFISILYETNGFYQSLLLFAECEMFILPFDVFHYKQIIVNPKDLFDPKALYKCCRLAKLNASIFENQEILNRTNWNTFYFQIIKVYMLLKACIKVK